MKNLYLHFFRNSRLKNQNLLDSMELNALLLLHLSVSP